MELDDVIQLELKYCERCGGLWIRAMGSEERYCAPCAIAMMDVAISSKRRSWPRLPGNHKPEKSDVPKLTLINGKGGNA